MLNDDSKAAEPTEENMTPSPGHGALRLPHSIHHSEHTTSSLITTALKKDSKVKHSLD